ncbi:MAG: M42 family peptidase, partial [Anaerolineales bacterium]|nr:M42 family peptidase [Anaerolineales bacterium]
AAFTVQEEVGLKGAQVAGYDIRPDLALILECTPAYDLPTDEDISPNVALGKGPSVYVMDSHTIQDPRFVAHIIRTATERGIPYQLRQPGGGGTNAGAYQPLHGSIPVATIATPGRYAHSPAMMINLQDYADVVRLADATLRNLSAELFARE